jgi:DNA-binding response OmpR family regulator
MTDSAVLTSPKSTSDASGMSAPSATSPLLWADQASNSATVSAVAESTDPVGPLTASAVPSGDAATARQADRALQLIDQILQGPLEQAQLQLLTQVQDLLAHGSTTTSPALKETATLAAIPASSSTNARTADASNGSSTQSSSAHTHRRPPTRHQHSASHGARGLPRNSAPRNDARPAASTTAASSTIDLRRADLQRGAVLILTSESATARVLTDWLNRCQCDPMPVIDAELAKLELQDNAYRMVIVDFDLFPELGHEQMADLRALHRMWHPDALPLVLVGLSTEPVADAVGRCRNAGMDECLPKPLHPLEVEKLLSERLPMRANSSTGPSSSHGSQSVLDLPQVRERCLYDGDFLRKILQSFLDQTETDIRTMQCLALSGHWSAVQTMARHMEQSSRSISAHVVARAAADLEFAAGTGVAALCESRVAELLQAFEQLTACIHEFLLGSTVVLR